MLPGKNLRRVLIITPQAEGDYSSTLQTAFFSRTFFPLVEMGEEIICVLSKTNEKNTAEGWRFAQFYNIFTGLSLFQSFHDDLKNLLTYLPLSIYPYLNNIHNSYIYVHLYIYTYVYT